MYVCKIELHVQACKVSSERQMCPSVITHWQLTDTACADLQELANAVYAKLQSWVDQFVYKR